MSLGGRKNQAMTGVTDPYSLFTLGKNSVIYLRLVGLAVPLVLAAMSLLAHFGKFGEGPALKWLGVPLAIAFVILAIFQAALRPYSKRKSLVYALIYGLLGVLMCAGLIGFPKVAFLGWVALGIVMDVYFGPKLALFSVGAMEASVVFWAILHRNIAASQVASVWGSSFVAVALIILVAIIWRRTLKSLRALDLSQKKTNLEQKRLSALINNMVDGVLAVDNHFRVRQYNAAALDILDLNASLLGKPLADIFTPLDANGRHLSIVHYLGGLKKAEVRRDLKLKYTDGSEINLYLASALVRLGYGRGDGGFTLILRDITREKSLEEERDEFISVVSHELRTPIAITEGNISNAEFVFKNAKSANRGELIEKSLDEAHKQVLFLAGMINDLSTLSRAERGKLEVEITPIDPVKLLDELLDNYRPEAEQRGLKLSLKHVPKLPPLNSSELYVREILQNFITNSLKYTETGSITIAASAKAAGIEFAVTDTGIGLSKQDKEKVFDKFFRSEDFRTRKTGGTGLGLYVTMKLARLLHADINVESELNHGSTFSIYFPNMTTGSSSKSAN